MNFEPLELQNGLQLDILCTWREPTINTSISNYSIVHLEVFSPFAPLLLRLYVCHLGPKRYGYL